MTAGTIAYQPPILTTPFDATKANATAPSPSQTANGFIPNVDKVNAEEQNYLHNSTTTILYLMQQLGLLLPWNPSAGASLVATKKGGIVSIKDSVTSETQFYVARSDQAIGYTDPSLDPTNWQLINFNEIAKYAATPVTLASASTVNIGAAASGNVTISGTTTVTAFDTYASGVLRWVTYSGAVPITYNGTSMILIGGASRTNAVGDFSIFQSLGSGNWKEVVYQSALATYPLINMTGPINTARGTVAMNATTMNLWAQPNIIDGTGSPVTVTAIVNSPQAGATRTLYPIAGSIITNGATFAVDGGANVTAAAGDSWTFEAVTTSTYKVHIVYAAPVAGTTKVISGTRDLSAASGSVNYTGFGGTPKWVIIRAGMQISVERSNGFSNGADNTCEYTNSGGNGINSIAYTVAADFSAGNIQTATATFSADTVTLAWTKTGTPSGTLYFTIEAHF